MTDTQQLPQSAVPAALDRGHLYSPTLALTRYALDPGVGYDYRPGELFEPMPEAPRGDGEAFARWWRSAALVESPDFLGLRTGDTVTLHSLQGDHFPATVVATCRHHASVRYPASEWSSEPYVQTYVTHRNAEGQWY
ncbi:hypothetical protein ACH4F6_38025 [Streptomyces sp. NPDC017936]|uniref:hypothetical protein n=1 Tax=Streptomyces sp. NPDC017936 TaxID=3365016 RepID=UPI00379D38A0